MCGCECPRVHAHARGAHLEVHGAVQAEYLVDDVVVVAHAGNGAHDQLHRRARLLKQDRQGGQQRALGGQSGLWCCSLQCSWSASHLAHALGGVGGVQGVEVAYWALRPQGVTHPALEHAGHGRHQNGRAVEVDVVQVEELDVLRRAAAALRGGERVGICAPPELGLVCDSALQCWRSAAVLCSVVSVPLTCAQPELARVDCAAHTEG